MQNGSFAWLPVWAAKAKAKPEFNPFDCRDAEHQRSNAAFDAVEHRVADAGRQSDGGTFDDTSPPNPVGRGCLQ